MNSIDITESNVFLELNNLVSKTKIAIDGTTNIVLKKISASLSLPLFLIFSKSLSAAEFFD